MNREVRREFIYLLDRMTPAQTRGVYLMLLFIRDGRPWAKAAAAAICAAAILGLAAPAWLMLAALLAALAVWPRLAWPLCTLAGDLWEAWRRGDD